MLATGWSWLSKHPRKAEVIEYVTRRKTIYPEPGWIASDPSRALINRDRAIHQHVLYSGKSNRETAKLLKTSRQTVSVCLRVYSGEVELPEPGRRRSLKAAAESKITKKVLEKYVAGETTFTEIMKLLGTERTKNCLYWIKKRSEELGVDLERGET